MVQPRISAVIPTKNRPEMLSRAIKSVLYQTIECFEIIIIDDSLDNSSVNIIRQFDCPKIVHIHSGGNKGGALSRNLGINIAKGDYIAFLDDDDEWVADKLRKQIALLKDRDVLCYSARTIWKGDSKKNRYSLHLPNSDDHYKSIMMDNFIGSTSSVIVKKSVLEEVGGIDQNLPALQDYDLYIRILKKYRACWVCEPLINYYDHHSGDQVSGSRSYYLKAVSYLRQKYKNDPYYKYLKRSLFQIYLHKMFRSRRFLIDTLKAGIKFR